jgi:hypothetical protein
MYGENPPFYDNTEFKGVNEYMSVKCSKCHREIKNKARMFIRPDKPFKCGYCSGKWKNTEIFKKEIYNLVGNKYTLMSEYKGAHEVVFIVHNLCGKDFETTPNKFITKNKRCTSCSVSNGEQLVKDYLNKMEVGYVYDRKFIGNKTCLSENGRSLRFDFQIINNNGNVCGVIEFDGEQHSSANHYFHDNEYRNTDDIKNNFCNKNNIPILRITICEILKSKNTLSTTDNISIIKLNEKIEGFIDGLNEDLDLGKTILSERINRKNEKIINKGNDILEILKGENLNWKWIKNYDRLYKISDKGDIIKFNSKGSPIKKMSSFKNGKYLSVNLTYNKKTSNYNLSKLIYSTFKDIEYENLKDMYIQYKDGNETNTSIDNLILISRDEWSRKTFNMNKKGCFKIDPKTKNRTYYHPISSASNDGYDPSAIVKCCKGKNNMYKGFYWEYDNFY